MGKCENDPNGYSPDDIIERLRRYIDSGRNGIDYISSLLGLSTKTIFYL